MGVLKKLKDIFYDEEIVEEEVEEEKPQIKEITEKLDRIDYNKEEVKKPKFDDIEIPRFKEPKEEIKPRTDEITLEDKTIPERELFQNKKTFNFPILNDDEKPMTRSNINVMDIEKKQKQERKLEQEEIKTNTSFRPSPVISPIYGILDKDFKKEDIISKNKQNDEIARKSTSFAYDTVRKKAYGTLGDELENSLSNTTKIEAEKILKEVDDIEKELNKLDESTPKTNLTNIVKDLEENEKITIGEMEKREKEIEIEPEDITREIKVQETSRIEKYKKETTPPKKTISDVGDKTLEHDLFNLIDSMYEEEE